MKTVPDSKDQELKSSAPPQEGTHPMQPSQYPAPTQPAYPPVSISSQAYPPQPPPISLHPGHRLLLGPSPQSLTCPFCSAQTLTKTSKQISLIAWVFVLVLCCVCLGTLLPLCCIPCCIPSCYDTRHFCGNCGAFVGMYNRMMQDT